MWNNKTHSAIAKIHFAIIASNGNVKKTRLNMRNDFYIIIPGSHIHNTNENTFLCQSFIHFELFTLPPSIITLNPKHIISPKGHLFQILIFGCEVKEYFVLKQNS